MEGRDGGVRGRAAGDERPVRPHHVLAAAATGFREFLARNGGEAEPLLCDVGVDDRHLTDANIALDLRAYVALMEKAAKRTQNDNFGLWYGQQFQPEMLGLIGGIAISAPTLGHGLTSLARMFPFHQQATATAFLGEGGYMRLEYSIMDGGIMDRRQDAELTMGMFANVLRHGLGPTWAPEEVHFEHIRPPGWREHEQAFSAPIYFGRRTNALVFSNREMARPMPRGDLRRMNSLCEQLVNVGRDRGDVPLSARVMGEIRRRLPDGLPTVEAVADALGVPRWTLQRRLADGGHTFSELVDLVRKNLAKQYVSDAYVPLLDIAETLGYSELSAFSRAFRRWFGVSPSVFRLAG
jgi:AraC-like DNA-binding protein